MGAGLLAKAVDQTASMSTDTPSSRAGSLPLLFCVWQIIQSARRWLFPVSRTTSHSPCGSGLARESGVSDDINVD
ncbi:hypothetical protein C0J26_10005 [Pseudomonas baetica]|nr:hypothetical protein C0J26_10005 [Pseudomonas baetica]